MADHPSTESLEAVHTFPCRFVVKAIGANEPAFVEAVEEATREALGEQPEADALTTTTRASSRGNHVSVTLSFLAQTPQDVQAVFARLKALEELRYIL
ncbi:MAG: hypothetical protein CMH57_14125 [Myxococcales bacterium]|nr:hypothetical protein [Myxococcales bacterium]